MEEWKDAAVEHSCAWQVMRIGRGGGSSSSKQQEEEEEEEEEQQQRHVCHTAAFCARIRGYETPPQIQL